MKRRIFMIIVCSMALSFLLAGCASSSDTEVDLPEADNVESIQLQFCDDSCTVSEIVDITDDNKNVITGKTRRKTEQCLSMKKVNTIMLNSHMQASGSLLRSSTIRYTTMLSRRNSSPGGSHHSCDFCVI